jgi:hypothetical protein
LKSSLKKPLANAENMTIKPSRAPFFVHAPEQQEQRGDIQQLRPQGGKGFDKSCKSGALYALDAPDKLDTPTVEGEDSGQRVGAGNADI